MKRALSLICSVLMLLSLCACSQPGTSTPSTTEPEPVLPAELLGTWYLHPEIGSESIQINEDGSCNLADQTLLWKIKSITEDKIVLIANEGEEVEYIFTFSQLTFPVPLLSITGYGVYIQQGNLWKYVTDWYCADNGNAFSLSFFELAQAGCELTINGDNMSVKVIKDGVITHTIELTENRAVVTNAQGTSTIYEPMN